MEGVIYFTKRSINDKGSVKAWVYKQKCPKCKKVLMGKPVDKKTGKVKIRAKEYTCRECGYTVEKKEYEESLTCEIKYTCPKCSYEGETEIPFKRKRVKVNNKMADALVFNCNKCGGKILITKKMK